MSEVKISGLQYLYLSLSYDTFHLTNIDYLCSFTLLQIFWGERKDNKIC